MFVHSDDSDDSCCAASRRNLAHNEVPCINNDTFTNLTRLKWLRLDGNQIRCVAEGTFSPLRSLEQMYAYALHITTFNAILYK